MSIVYEKSTRSSENGWEDENALGGELGAKKTDASGVCRAFGGVGEVFAAERVQNKCRYIDWVI